MCNIVKEIDVGSLCNADLLNAVEISSKKISIKNHSLYLKSATDLVCLTFLAQNL